MVKAAARARRLVVAGFSDQQDAVAGLAAAQLAHGQPGLAGQGVGRLQIDPAPAGQLIFAGLAPRPGHPLRIGLGQQQGVVQRRGAGRPAGAAGPALRQRASIPRPWRAVAVETLQPVAQVDIAAAQALLAEHGGDLRAPRGLAGGGGPHHHVGQARGQRHVGQGPAMGGQAALPVQGLQAIEQDPGLGEGGGRRLVEEGQAAGVPRAPPGQVQGQARQVGLQDLGPGEGRQGPGLRLVPQAVADARLGAAGPAPALVGGGAADAHGLQPGQAAGRVEARHAGQAAVDHHPHALDGQAGLGDRGGQHHLAPPRRGGGHGTVLFGRLQRAVQRRDIDLGPPQPLAQQGLDAPDLALARQEDQQTAALLGQGPLDGADHALLQPLAVVAAQIAGVDREHPPLALDDRRLTQQGRDPRSVQGGRHHQDLQVLAHQALCVAGQGQAQVGVQAALVELVEDHRRHAVQARIVENHPGEHALGHHLDPGPGRDLRLQPDPEPHRLADALAQALGHARGRGPGRQAARLQHDDLAVAHPGLVQQGQRHDRGLARAGRRDQHGGLASGERGFQGRQGFVDRKGHAPGFKGAAGNRQAPATDPGSPGERLTLRQQRSGSVLQRNIGPADPGSYCAQRGEQLRTPSALP